MLSDVGTASTFQTNVQPPSPTLPDSPTLPNRFRSTPQIPTRSSSLDVTKIVSKPPRLVNRLHKTAKIPDFRSACEAPTPLVQKPVSSPRGSVHAQPLRSHPTNAIRYPPRFDSPVSRAFATRRLNTARVRLLSTISVELQHYMYHPTHHYPHMVRKLYTTFEALIFRCEVNGTLLPVAIEAKNETSQTEVVGRSEDDSGGEQARKLQRGRVGNRHGPVESISEPVAVLRGKWAQRVEGLRTSQRMGDLSTDNQNVSERTGDAEVQRDVIDIGTLCDWAVDDQGESDEDVEAWPERVNEHDAYNGDATPDVDSSWYLEYEVSDANKQVFLGDIDVETSTRGRSQDVPRPRSKRSVSAYWRRKAEKHPNVTMEESIRLASAWKHRYDLDIAGCEDDADNDGNCDCEEELSRVETGMNDDGSDDDDLGEFDYHNTLRELAGMAINF